MDGRQNEAIKKLKKHLQGLDDALSLQQKLLQERGKQVDLITQSVIEAEGAVVRSEEELKEARRQFDDAVRENRIVHAECERPEGTTQLAHSSRDKYVLELSGAGVNLTETQSRVHGLVDEVEALNEAAGDAEARRRLTLVSLISMLDDLHALLSRNVEQVSFGRDARAQEVFKAIRELSRERERAISYCLRKKREVEDVINLKKQRADELLADAQQDHFVRCDTQGLNTCSAAEKIQAERKALQEEIESIKNDNKRLWEALRNTKYSSDAMHGGNHKREAAILANEVLQENAGAEGEKEHLREQLKLFDAKRAKLQRMIEELRVSINEDSEKHAQKLKDLKREIQLQQHESQKIEEENRKLKSLCDSLVTTLDA